MSKGPGRIERAIEAIFAAEPDNAFTTDDLCDRVYRTTWIERKHRVAVLRAATKICVRKGWDKWQSEAPGGTLVFRNVYNVMSHGMARLKSDVASYRRPNSNRTEESLRAELAPGGRYHKYITEGGVWWKHQQLEAAERDGDTSDRIQQIRASVEADLAALRASFGLTTKPPSS